MTVDDLPERLEAANTAIDGVSIHLIRTGCGIALAKAVVNLKAAAQDAAAHIRSLKGENARLAAERYEARASSKQNNEDVDTMARGWNIASERARAAETALAKAVEGLEKIVNTGQSTELEHWEFRCMAHKIALETLASIRQKPNNG